MNDDPMGEIVCQRKAQMTSTPIMDANGNIYGGFTRLVIEEIKK